MTKRIKLKFSIDFLFYVEEYLEAIYSYIFLKKRLNWIDY